MACSEAHTAARMDAEETLREGFSATTFPTCSSTSTPFEHLHHLEIVDHRPCGPRQLEAENVEHIASDVIAGLVKDIGNTIAESILSKGYLEMGFIGNAHKRIRKWRSSSKGITEK